MTRIYSLINRIHVSSNISLVMIPFIVTSISIFQIGIHYGLVTFLPLSFRLLTLRLQYFCLVEFLSSYLPNRTFCSRWATKSTWKITWRLRIVESHGPIGTSQVSINFNTPSHLLGMEIGELEMIEEMLFTGTRDA